MLPTDTCLTSLQFDNDSDATCQVPPVAIRLVAPPRRSRSPILATAIAAIVLSQSASGAAGDLDPTFGHLGRAVLPETSLYQAWSLAALADGSSFYAGSDEHCDYYGCYYGSGAGRLLDNGVVDTSFAPAFLATTRITDLVARTDQKIVGIGESSDAGAPGFVVLRMQADGLLDGTFAGGGLQVFDGPVGEAQRAWSLLIDDQQRIVIAGARAGKLLVMRLLEDGTLDLAFGNAGVYIGSVINAQAGLPRVAVAGSGYRVMLNSGTCQVLALTATGTVDATYGVAGYAGPGADTSCTALAAQDDGKLVLGGYHASAPAIWRLQSGGAVDAGFDGGAIADRLTQVSAIATAGGGKILVAGRRAVAEGSAGHLLRLQSSGALDASFGSGGVSQFDLESPYASHPLVHEIRLTSGGRILLAGGWSAGNVSRPFVVRLLAEGESGPGVIAMAGTSPLATEASGQAVVNVRRLGGSHGAVSVQYDTVAESYGYRASSGVDYTATSGRLQWADGDTADKQIVVPVAADTVAFESPESFDVQLSDPQGGAGLGTRGEVVTIAGDGYPAGAFVIQSQLAATMETDATAGFVVSRRNYGQGAVSVTVTLSGTATNGVDYSSPSPLTLSWGNGDMSDKVVTVRIRSDHHHESDESIVATLSGPTGGAVLAGQTSSTMTVMDNDSAGGGGGSFGVLGTALLGLAALGRRIRRRS